MRAQGRATVRGWLGLAAILVALGLPAGASAATDFGDQCAGNDVTESAVTIFEVSSSLNPLPTAAPSAGVITRWGVNLAPMPLVVPTTLKVLREIGPSTAQIVGEASGTVVAGANLFLTRLPVQAGDRLGYFGPSALGALLCQEPSAGGTVGLIAGGGGGVGAVTPFVAGPTPDLRIPLYANLEADADADGYGDETQDLCPQNAATQGECPPPAVALKLRLKGKPKLEGNVVAVKLTTSAQARVKATGSIHGRRAAKPASKTVKPGETGRFYLLLTKTVKRRLANLPRKRRLRMVVEAKASGSPTVSAEISLPGRKKPPRAGAPR